jgi:hypothetical protein
MIAAAAAFSFIAAARQLPYCRHHFAAACDVSLLSIAAAFIFAFQALSFRHVVLFAAAAAG